jgi:hypothetical protein
MTSGLSERGRIAARLLDAESIRASVHGDTPKVLPPALAVINLFVAASFEQYLQGTRYAYGVTLFLFFEGTLFFILSTTWYVTTTSLILERTRIFPITVGSRILFVALSGLRTRAVVFLWASTVLCLLILHHRSGTEVVFAPLLYSLFLLSIQGVIVAAFLIFSRFSQPMTLFAWFGGFLLALILIGAVLFRHESLFDVIVPLVWTSAGTVAAREGNMPAVLLNVAYLILFTAGIVAVARRFA